MVNSRKALLVGTATYGHDGLRPLKAPLNDLDALAEVLGDPDIGGYTVIEVRDRPVHLIQRAVQRFLVHSEPDDELLLYFSCHGLKDDEELLYFAGTDTEPEPELLESHAVPAEFVSKYLQTAIARRKILLLDCCFSGAFRAGAKSANPRLDIGGTFTESGTYVISASDRIQQAFELKSTADPKPLSVFTDAVVRGLRSGDADLDGDGQVSADDLYKYVSESLRAAGSRQNPTRSIVGGIGDLKLTLQRKPQEPTPGAVSASPPFDAAAVRRVLAEAPFALDAIIDPAPDHPVRQRFHEHQDQTRSEHLIAYVNRGHHNDWFGFKSREYEPVAFTDGAVYFPGAVRMTYSELAAHDITVDRKWHKAYRGGFHTSHLVLQRPGRTVSVNGAFHQGLEALAAVLTELGRLATEASASPPPTPE
ncbi:caspase family protein [Glycomyces rhizosphaerae]|uniref:Caspase domain-containing protein n=1 Tax=Glycomyces rhizosphaerae TaxID=2054422 RepID=A0ABV7Q0U4_9ACTN